MTDNGAQLIFSELLARHGRIRVPLIQRDYAQGRRDQEEVRDAFLAALHDALVLPVDSVALPLNLDFIYGSVEGENPTSFQPLDGQQRLTTLFLLHWYLAWRDGSSTEFGDLCADGGLSRFSYQVRPSSKEFFDELVRFSPEQEPDEVERLASLLQDQPWYFRSWRLDPTIQSALVMLDAIHDRFKDTQDLYARLTDTTQPAITFQLLDLNNFGLSDDLYIKMNARGKPLTPFETFKARYEQILRDQFPDQNRLIDGQPLSVAGYFVRRMDTRWADFFWPYRDPKSHIFDEAVMNVFRVVILITRSTDSPSFTDDIRDLRSRFQKNSFHFFHQRGWLDVPFAETLIALMDAWSSKPGEFAPLLPDARYFDEEAVLEKVMNEPTTLGYDELVQIAAYVQFVRTHEDDLNPDAFQAWMRVVFNLSVNTEYNRASDFQRSLSSLAYLSPNMPVILDYMADPETDFSGFFRPQVAEEQTKARLLLADASWKPLIEKAEGHGYFRGQIGFLLKFAGIESDTDDTLRHQAAFTDYLDRATAMFGDRGLNSLPDFRWERALLSLGNYLLDYRQNESFLVNQQSDQASWKRLLRDAASGTSQGKVLKKLWAAFSGTSNIGKQLDSIIASASDIEAWRGALIETPTAIGYCGKRMIRHTANGLVYLLSKIQTNGAHAELFSYCFYKNVASPAGNSDKYEVFRPAYYESNTADIEPGIQLHFGFSGLSLVLDIEYQPDEYRLWVSFEEELPEALSKVFRELGFSKSEKRIQKTCSVDSLENFIADLDQKLAAAIEEGLHG